LHGEAVAAGMVMAIDLSIREGLIDEALRERTVALLKRSSLPIEPPPGITVRQYLDTMAIDKKALDGHIRLILLRALGEAFISADYAHDNLRETLKNSRPRVNGI